MALSAAEKVRRHRARRRKGEAVLRINVNLGAVADWLIDHQKLAEWDATDRDQIQTSLENAVKFWSRYETG